MLLHVQKNIRWHCRDMLLHGHIIIGCMLLLSNLCWFDIADIKSAMLLPSCYYWMFKILLKLHWFYNCLNTTWPCNSMALHWSLILNGLSCISKTLRLAHNAFKIVDNYFLNSGDYFWVSRWDMLLHGHIINGCMLLLSNLCWFGIARHLISHVIAVLLLIECIRFYQNSIDYTIGWIQHGHAIAWPYIDPQY